MPSPPRYQIIVYECQTRADEVPGGCHFAAALLLGYDPQPRWFCSGATPGEARERMEAWFAKTHPQKAPKPPEPSPANVDDELSGEVL